MVSRGGYLGKWTGSKPVEAESLCVVQLVWFGLKRDSSEFVGAGCCFLGVRVGTV
jgi:hypothetical protein